jgi:hypothetical protein
MAMPGLDEVAANFRALGHRKKQILDICNAALQESLDEVLSQLGSTGENANRFWRDLFRKLSDDNRKVYPLPDQVGVRTAADNYAGGIIERMKEAILFNQHNPAYIAFIREQGRLPEPGDKY